MWRIQTLDLTWDLGDIANTLYYMNKTSFLQRPIFYEWVKSEVEKGAEQNDTKRLTFYFGIPAKYNWLFPKLNFKCSQIYRFPEMCVKIFIIYYHISTHKSLLSTPLYWILKRWIDFYVWPSASILDMVSNKHQHKRIQTKSKGFYFIYCHQTIDFNSTLP